MFVQPLVVVSTYSKSGTLPSSNFCVRKIAESAYQKGLPYTVSNPQASNYFFRFVPFSYLFFRAQRHNFVSYFCFYFL